MVKKTLCTSCGKEKNDDSNYQGRNWTCPACAQKELQQLRKDMKKLEEKFEKQIKEFSKKMMSLKHECIDCTCQRDDFKVELEEERKENARLNEEVKDLRDINRIKEEEILFVYKEMERIRNLTNRGYSTLISSN